MKSQLSRSTLLGPDILLASRSTSQISSGSLHKDEIIEKGIDKPNKQDVYM